MVFVPLAPGMYYSNHRNHYCHFLPAFYKGYYLFTRQNWIIVIPIIFLKLLFYSF